jgi:Zn-dependent protease
MIGRASLRLGTIGPIEINVNVTWLAVFALLVYWLRVGYVAENAGDLSRIAAWLVSGAGALILFASVLAHELSHSLVAIRNGLPIRKITLFIFGGVAHMESEPKTPGVEFKMAIAGPLMSIAIAAVAGLLRFGLLGGSPTGVAALIAEYAFFANAVLACFNLVPGFPLDGGRVLRALLWKVTRNYVKSTLVASAIGRAFGLAMVFAGITAAMAYELPGFLWPVLVGIFIERLAHLSAVRVRRMRPRRTPPGGTAGRRAGFAPISATPRPVYHRPSISVPGSRRDDASG